MRLFLLAVLLAAPSVASAAACEGSYAAQGQKATRWFALGEVTGARAHANCVAKAKDDAMRRKPAELGVPKWTCAQGPVVVSVYARIDPKGKAAPADAVVKTTFGQTCKAAAP